jgi:hypothetical protein
MFAFLKKNKIRKKVLLVFLFTILVLVGSFFVYKYTKASYAVISFTEVGPHTWVVPDGAISADILIVAGGGGGGYRHGAGGGAGGLIFKENYSLTPGSSITINVGAGGKGATGSSAATRSTNGGDSSFDSFIAIGGGAAGQWDAYRSGSSGGSGGGSASNYKASGTAGQGNSGGGLLSNYKHGGGGGAGEAGTDGTADSNGMGGKGLYYGNIFGDDYGENGWFAGGGGGGSHNPAPLNRGLGGLGGGGNGGTPGTFQDGDNGLSNTGGGGGGASSITGGSNKGGNGGSGVVIIRYKLKPGTAKGIQTYSGLVGHFKMGADSYIEGTNNFIYNPTGKLISNGTPGSYKPGWDETLHSDAIIVYNWSTGYNGGVGSPAIGYHAKWVYEGIDGANDPCIKFVDKNDVYGLGHRWQGISQSLGTPASLGWVVGDKITISWKQKVDVLNRGSRVGLYHHLISTGSYSFNGSIATIYGKSVNNWEQTSFTITIDNDWDLNKNFIIYVYSSGSSYGTTWVDNVQVEKKDHSTPFVSGTRIGRLTDSSAYENHGTTPINQSFILSEDRFGREGGAMSFDGLSNYIDAGSSNILNSNTRTISAWIKTASTGTVNNSGTIVSKIANTPPHNGFVLNINREAAGKIYYYAGSWYGTNSSDYNNGNWRHIVVVHEGTNLRFYKDGVLDGSYTASSPTNYEANLLIGKERDGAPRLFNGSIDDVRIYNRALSEEEIKSLYDSYSPKTTTGSLEQGLILDMPLKSKYTKSETAGSQIMTDRTAYSRDGQNSGATITEEGASFNGSNYYHIKTINNILLDDSQVYSAWVKVPAIDGALRGVLTTHNHAQTSNLGINIINGKFYISIGYADGTREYNSKGTSFSITPNEWAHVVLVYNKSENSVQFYVNGNPDNKWMLTKTVKFTPEKISVGIWSTTYSGYLYNGQISNLLIYNRALSEDEVKTLYNRGRSDVGIMFQTKN